MQTITRAQAVSMIEDTRDSGIIFGVTFTKRTDGTMRTMSARLGVKKGVKGVGLAFSPSEKRLISCYDMHSSFRFIPTEGIRMLKIHGEEFEVLP